MPDATISYNDSIAGSVYEASNEIPKRSRTKPGFRLSVRIKLMLAFTVTTAMTIVIATVALDTQQAFRNQQSTTQSRLLPAISAAKSLQDVTRKIVAIGPEIVSSKSAEEIESAISLLPEYGHQARSQINQLRVSLGKGASGDDSQTGAISIDSRKIDQIESQATNLTSTLTDMAAYVTDIEQQLIAYKAEEQKIEKSISNILQRIKGISDTTHRDSKISITDISVAIDRGGQQAQAQAALRKLSQEKLDVFRWVFSLMDTTGALSAGIQRLKLESSPEETLQAKAGLYLLTKTLLRSQRAAILDEHAESIAADIEVLRNHFSPNSENSLVELWAGILEKRQSLATLLSSNELLSNQLNSRVKEAVDQNIETLRNEADHTDTVIEQATRTIWITTIAAVLTALLIGIFFVHISIIRRVEKLNNVMASLADGDTEVCLPKANRDEIGRMVKAVAVFRNNMIETRQMRVDLADDFNQRLVSILDKVQKMVEQLNIDARSMQEAAASASQGSQSVTSAIQHTNDNVTQVSASTQELALSIREIEHQVTESETMVSCAVDEAKRSHANLVELNEAASRVEEMLTMINEVSEKTNLLALNAAIEAARAGEAGLGFAVVAHEVKNLSNDTSNSAMKIREMVAQMQTASSNANHAVSTIIDKVTFIEQAFTSVAAAVTEQAAVTDGIGQNSSEVVSSMHTVAEGILSLSQTVEQTNRQAREVQDMALVLTENNRAIRLEADRFVQSMLT
ncbi:hypothetical protein BTA51_03455 [Hahella sp. CCB-MM4]|uniref:methyl-accepting chemotaxis protein n=1 Tax=Hahella sp. (strain CCB-MM4) TaxID=1926491 RepID=UPI000B9AEF09|nr:methyl-accepting chemotaxis protein [Hahella sp. CCB-MM4]OZG75441.1 hypothetical protein BTA51_03455 [Hahella sp. CCB-MM4]